MKNPSFTLLDLPREERPRERLLQNGIDALSSQELLALILGRGISGESVMRTAQKLLVHFGSVANLQQASLEDLQSIRGIGLAKACQIIACFALSKRTNSKTSSLRLSKGQGVSSFQAIITHIQQRIGFLTKEHFAVISLDARAVVIGIDIIFVGSLSTSIVHPRETFEAAIRRHAAKIIISHNHPSGNSQPSEQDIFITRQLMDAGNIFGIPVIDHIIVTKNTFYSFQNDSDIR